MKKLKELKPWQGWAILAGMFAVVLPIGAVFTPSTRVDPPPSTTTTTTKARKHVSSYCDRVTGDCVEAEYDYGD